MKLIACECDKFSNLKHIGYKIFLERSEYVVKYSCMIHLIKQ